MLPLLFKHLKLVNYELHVLNYISTTQTLITYTYVIKYLKYFKSIHTLSYLRLGIRYIGLRKIRAIKRHTRKRLMKKSDKIKF